METNTVRVRRRLREIATKALEAQGWTVQKMPGTGKSSLRRLVRGTEQRIVSMKTSRDTWVAFARNAARDGWETLSDVEMVVIASVDDPEHPKEALIHLVPADDMRDRFDRALKARLTEGYSPDQDRGIWISLYREDAPNPVVNVGAGAGLAYPPIARVPLEAGEAATFSRPGDPVLTAGGSSDGSLVNSGINRVDAEAPLTIAAAKRRLAATFGVPESNIKITVEA